MNSYTLVKVTIPCGYNNLTSIWLKLQLYIVKTQPFKITAKISSYCNQKSGLPEFLVKLPIFLGYFNFFFYCAAVTRKSAVTHTCNDSVVALSWFLQTHADLFRWDILIHSILSP